jgi:hypothetical protein
MSKDLHLEEIDKTIVENERVSNFTDLMHGRKEFKEINTLSKLMRNLENIRDEVFDNVYVGNRLLATLIDPRFRKNNSYELNEENADYFSNEYGVELQSYVFRLEKTNINNGDYSLFLKIGKDEEKTVLNNEGKTFVSSNEKEIINYMEIVSSRLDSVNDFGEYDSGVHIKALLLQVRDDIFPLSVMQGDRKVSNDYAVDEFARNFPSSPIHTITNFIPYYEVKPIKNNKIESAVDDLVGALKDSNVDISDVVNLLKRKTEEQEKKSIQENSNKKIKRS